MTRAALDRLNATARRDLARVDRANRAARLIAARKRPLIGRPAGGTLDRATQLRTVLSVLTAYVPAIATIRRWPKRHRAHVERWAARELLVLTGAVRMRRLRAPAVLVAPC